MSLLSNRDYYKPFDHPWMFEKYVEQNQMHWLPESVPLHTDVKDWQDDVFVCKHGVYTSTCLFITA